MYYFMDNLKSAVLRCWTLYFIFFKLKTLDGLCDWDSHVHLAKKLTMHNDGASKTLDGSSLLGQSDVFSKKS